MTDVLDKNRAVDEALQTSALPPFPAGPLLPRADVDKLRMAKMTLVTDPAAREAALRDLVPNLPGDRYDDGRDTSLAEFVVLQLGCGRKQRLEQLPPIACYDGTGEVRPPLRLINLDGMRHVGAHLTATLGVNAVALPDDSVDLILATHVLEHIGRQGELEAWFQFWGEAYRVLKPEGRLQFVSPYFTSVWCWSDPTHVRAISEYVFLFLNQDSYRVPAEQTAIPDYRPPCDFSLARWELLPDTSNPALRAKEGRSHIAGVLVARKPFRPYWQEAS